MLQKTYDQKKISVVRETNLIFLYHCFVYLGDVVVFAPTLQEHNNFFNLYSKIIANSNSIVCFLLCRRGYYSHVPNCQQIYGDRSLQSVHYRKLCDDKSHFTISTRKTR